MTGAQRKLISAAVQFFQCLRSPPKEHRYSIIHRIHSENFDQTAVNRRLICEAPVMRNIFSSRILSIVNDPGLHLVKQNSRITKTCLFKYTEYFTAKK